MRWMAVFLPLRAGVKLPPSAAEAPWNSNLQLYRMLFLADFLENTPKFSDISIYNHIHKPTHMKSAILIFILKMILFFPALCQAQSQGEWVVEMNPLTGSFAAVGPMLEEISLVYVNSQCKDEVNGQYIFRTPPNDIFAVDISNGEIVDEGSMPTTIPAYTYLDFHCWESCDSLLVIGRDNLVTYTFLAFYDRFNSDELSMIGDSLPDDNPEPWSFSTMTTAFDPVSRNVYMHSSYANVLRVIDVLSGEITETFPVNVSPLFLAFDEVNGKLYALEFSSNSYRLMRFDTDTNDFVQIGQPFTSISSGHLTSTIDGNNQRLILTRSNTFNGSFVTTIDLNTGALLADVMTMPGDPGGGPFGGPNTVNGQYFNSTDQLITLHWGTGSNIHTNTTALTDPASTARIVPNPNQGDFRIDLDESRVETYHVRIVNLTGQVLYENRYLRKDQSIHSNLTPGYYLAHVLGNDGAPRAQVPFVVANR